MKLLMIDEAHSLFDNEHLKDELRHMPGVPNATHVIEGGRVFVYSQLVHQVAQAMRKQGLGKPTPELVAEKLPEAWVSLEDAVHSYSVCPPYHDLVRRAEGWVVVYRPLNAVLPGVFATRNVGQMTLKMRLAGETVQDEGSWSEASKVVGKGFELNGQAMRLETSFEASTLPPKPKLQVPAVVVHAFEASAYDKRAQCFLPFAEFHALEAEYQEWQAARSWLTRAVLGARAWAMLQPADFARLNETARAGTWYAADEQVVTALRSLYPELASMSQPALLEAWDAFCDGNSDPVRVEEFALYLVGRCALTSDDFPPYDNEVIVDLGRWCAEAQEQGLDFVEGRADARKAAERERAVNTRYALALRALHHMKELEALRPGQGLPVVTTLDMLRTMRKVNSVVQTMSQSLFDFSA